MGIGRYEGPGPRNEEWHPPGKKVESAAETPEAKYKVAIRTISEFLLDDNIFNNTFGHRPDAQAVERVRDNLGLPVPTEDSEQFQNWKKEAGEGEPRSYSDFVTAVEANDRAEKIAVHEYDTLLKLKEEVSRGETENAVQYFLTLGGYDRRCLEAVKNLLGY